MVVAIQVAAAVKALAEFVEAIPSIVENIVDDHESQYPKTDCDDAENRAPGRLTAPRTYAARSASTDESEDHGKHTAYPGDEK